MVFVIESIVACLLFTLMLELATRNRREAFANDYPPVVTDKLRVLGLIAQKPPAKQKDAFLWDKVKGLANTSCFYSFHVCRLHFKNKTSGRKHATGITHICHSL